MSGDVRRCQEMSGDCMIDMINDMIVLIQSATQLRHSSKLVNFFSQPSQPELTAVHRVLQETEHGQLHLVGAMSGNIRKPWSQNEHGRTLNKRFNMFQCISFAGPSNALSKEGGRFLKQMAVNRIMSIRMWCTIPSIRRTQFRFQLR